MREAKKGVFKLERNFGAFSLALAAS